MISVCMATYNGEKFIKEQIDSILPQLSNDDEIIISDDGSTDKTVDIIENYYDSRIKLLKDNRFRSTIYNLENALKHSNGDVVFLCDQDDKWSSNKVEICLSYMDDYDLIIHDAYITDSNLNITHDSFFKVNNTKYGKWQNIVKNGYHGCCMVVKRKLLNAVLPFPQKLPMHDMYIGNFAAFNNFKIKFIKEKLLFYRRHENSVSESSNKSKRKLSDRIKDRYIILTNVFTKDKKC